MKNDLKKFAKGMFAIATIKLLFFGLVFLNQACQIEEFIDINKEQALNNFENQLYRSKSSIENFVSDYNLNDDSKRRRTYSKHLEQEASKIVNPLVGSSIDLIKSYGISLEELSEHFSDFSDERLVLIGLILYSSEKEFENSISSIRPTNLFIQSSYANLNMMYRTPKWVECGMAAIGADFLFSSGVEGATKNNKWTRKALIKLIGKVATRMLGPIGAVIAVGTFVACMW